MKAWHFVLIPVIAYAVKVALFWPTGWTNQLEIKIRAPRDFTFKYVVEHALELERKHYPMNVNDKTKIVSDEMLDPNHRVIRTSVVKKTVSAFKYVPGFLTPDPNWTRESHIHLDQKLMDIRLSGKSIGMFIKFSFHDDADVASILRVDTNSRTPFCYKCLIWYSGLQEKSQLSYIKGVKQDVEAAYSQADD